MKTLARGRTTALKTLSVLFGLLCIPLASRATQNTTVNDNREPAPGAAAFWNWPHAALTVDQGRPNARDVTVVAHLVFPNQQFIPGPGQVRRMGSNRIEIALLLPGAEVLLPAIQEHTHRYVINHDPNTAFTLAVVPGVTHHPLNLPDGEYTVAFILNGRELATTRFSLGGGNEPPPPPPPQEVRASFELTTIYGSGRPILGYLGRLRFPQPIGYTLDEASLGDDNLEVVGPSGVTLAVTYLGVEIQERYPPMIVAGYQIAAPPLSDQPVAASGMTWLERDFTVSVKPDSITFNDGSLAVRGGPVGKIVVQWPPPEGGFEVRAEIGDVTGPSLEPHTFLVAYRSLWDRLDLSTLGDTNILVHGFRDRRLHYARFLGLVEAANTTGEILAQYALDPPQDSGWTLADNGIYPVFLGPKSVATEQGWYLAERRIGDFAVRIGPFSPAPPPPPPGLVIAPIVVAEARHLFASPSDPLRDVIPYPFRLLAIDQTGVDLASVEAATLYAYRFPRPVTHLDYGWIEEAIASGADLGSLAPNTDPSRPLPGQVRLTATLGNVTALDNAATVVQATGELIAPDGVWDANDNGHYLLALAPGQIANSSGATHPGGIVGRFSVMIYGPIEDAVERADGWSWSPFLGFFSEQTFPWFAHPEHGWWCAAVPAEVDREAPPAKGDWFYDLELEDWVFAEESVYPFLYSALRDEWLFYFQGTRAPRLFHGMRTEETFSSAD